MSSRDLSKAHEFINDRLYYVSLRTAPRDTSSTHFFTIDNELVYWNFFLDFGPLNLGQVYRFCQKLTSKLRSKKYSGRKIYFYSSSHPHKRANAAFLISAYAMLVLGRSAEDAYAPFRGVYPPFPPFHDASPVVCTFNLTILDCLRGMEKAHRYKFFDFESFPIDEYEHYEQVDNGDLNWIIDGRFCAFAGPHNSAEESTEGYSTLTPEHYFDYFKQRDVRLVVRLNKKYYDEGRFLRQGIGHVQLYYLDGSTPSDEILQRFIAICEETDGGIAVHCKAGLGRTGTCIGAYIMKHYKMTAHEVIGWIRTCRPGSIIGPQQHYMKQIEAQLWRDGDAYRRSRNISRIPSAKSALAPGRIGAAAAGASTPDDEQDARDARDRRKTSPGVDAVAKSLSSLSLSGARAMDASAAAAASSTSSSSHGARYTAAAHQSGGSREYYGRHSSSSGAGAGASPGSGNRGSPLSAQRRATATVSQRAFASAALSPSSALYEAGARAARGVAGTPASDVSQGDHLRRARRSPGSPAGRRTTTDTTPSRGRSGFSFFR